MIAKRLRELRESWGNSQDGMASVAEVSQRTWSEWERTDPKQVISIAKLARHYEVSADYLLGLTDDPRPPTQRALPDGSSALLELYARMTEQGQANLLAVAHALADADERRRTLHTFEDWIATMGGDEYLGALRDTLQGLIATHGSFAAALAELDRLTREQTAQHARQDTQ